MLQPPASFNSQAISTYKQVQQFYQAQAPEEKSLRHPVPEEKSLRHHSSAVDLNYTNPLLVYPRVEESEDLPLRSRTQAYQRTSDSRDG